MRLKLIQKKFKHKYIVILPISYTIELIQTHKAPYKYLTWALMGPKNLKKYFHSTLKFSLRSIENYKKNIIFLKSRRFAPLNVNQC